MRQVVEHRRALVTLYLLVSVFLVLCLFGFFSDVNVNYSDIYRECIAEVGFFAVLLYWIYSGGWRQPLRVRFSFARAWLVVFLVLATLSVFWSAQVYFFISKYVLYLATAAVVLLALALPCEQRYRLVLARGLVGALAVVAIIGLVQALFAVDIFNQAKSPAAMFVNKNVAAQFVVLVFPLSLFLLVFDGGRRWSWVYPFLIALVLAYAFHMYTRSAWLSIALQVLLVGVWVVVNRQMLRQGFKQQVFCRSLSMGAVLLAVVLLLVLVHLSAQGWQSFFYQVADEAGDVYRKVQAYHVADGGSHRYLIWQSAWLMVQQNPWFGTGLGSFYHNLVTQSADYPARGELRVHNDLLELGVELGVVGWLVFLAVVVSMLSAVVMLIRRGAVEDRVFFVLLAVALAGSALNMQLSFPYQMPLPLMIFGLYVGLVIRASDAYNDRVRCVDLSLRPWHWYLGMAVVVVLIGCLLFVNWLWLGAFSRVNLNVQQRTWQEDTVSHSSMCHKTLTKSLLDVAVFYTNAKEYESSNMILDSFAGCVPNTWSYSHMRAHNLIALERHRSAAEMLESVKYDAPKGLYVDYYHQFVAYNNVGDLRSARFVYDEFKALPTELLVLKKSSLKNLVTIAVDLQEIEDARRLYALYREYHGDSSKLQVLMSPYLP